MGPSVAKSITWSPPETACFCYWEQNWRHFRSDFLVLCLLWWRAEDMTVLRRMTSVWSRDISSIIKTRSIAMSHGLRCTMWQCGFIMSTSWRGGSGLISDSNLLAQKQKRKCLYISAEVWLCCWKGENTTLVCCTFNIVHSDWSGTVTCMNVETIWTQGARMGGM